MRRACSRRGPPRGSCGWTGCQGSRRRPRAASAPAGSRYTNRTFRHSSRYQSPKAHRTDHDAKRRQRSACASARSRPVVSLCGVPCSTSATARSLGSTGCGLPIADLHICLNRREAQGAPHEGPESDQDRYDLGPIAGPIAWPRFKLSTLPPPDLASLVTRAAATAEPSQRAQRSKIDRLE